MKITSPGAFYWLLVLATVSAAYAIGVIVMALYAKPTVLLVQLAAFLPTAGSVFLLSIIGAIVLSGVKSIANQLAKSSAPSARL